MENKGESKCCYMDPTDFSLMPIHHEKDLFTLSLILGGLPSTKPAFPYPFFVTNKQGHMQEESNS